MGQFLRTFGVAVLAAAFLDASAGLCFCHRGPAVSGPAPSSHSCCHEQSVPGGTAVKAASFCCHVESAERDAVPTPAVHVVVPDTPAAVADDAIAFVPCRLARQAPTAPSPPILILRI